MSQKIKDRIEKLLNLSLSDNEHESSVALQKALKLMNEHNITKEDINKQNFVSEVFDFECVKVLDWMSTLYTNMSYISGCVFTFKNGRFGNKAFGRITGKERDVINANYLCDFLLNAIKKRSEIHKQYLELMQTPRGKKVTKLRSFKVGIINSVFKTLLRERETFFSKSNATDLVYSDLDNKRQNSRDFLTSLIEVKDNNNKTIYDKESLNDGKKAGDNITLHAAVNKQDSIKQLN